MAHTTVVSAPGKVLISGGYLVLDPKYSGTVVSTSSRFYTVVRDDTSAGANRIRVRSPQFSNATWEYAVSTTATEVLVEELPTNTSKNKFVHLALQNTLALAAEIKGIASVSEALAQGIDIGIVGDNDFYSQREKLASLNLPRTLDSLHQIPPFTPTGVPLSQVHKTGLGSSAALITSLVSALLLHFSTIPASSLSSPSRSDGRLLAHNLAQYVHCFAQGKVGSGFDVSAAVFGSHIYTRFDPAVLHGLMNHEALRSQPLNAVLAPTNKTWDYVVKPFKLPPLTRLMLADVDAGSDTPSLVGKVLKWRNENPEEALALWTSVDKLNTRLAQTLVDLSKLYDEDQENYTTAVKYIASLQSIQWHANPFQPEAERPIISKFYEAHEVSQAIRAEMRKMGDLAGVPIEPKEQTQLLDACISLAGIIGGGVPGAGGYDAIWLLVCDPVDASPDVRPLERVQQTWSEYKDLDVSPLSCVESLAGGARVESLDAIPGLKEATTISG
ncbi:putative GHMP kinase family. Mevalonate kinase subfamily protein [Lyophyllum shimeji]|uniref:Phosphomevalonate kinase n=1 Tax=Lyophyllum shimeji TaxID=47721 RepID=A0A9P3PKC6_LYOSH|nr:putative GHMP kinase family. Mevalonate kinase subfamily protein [Lyophyllum shimeji]